MAKSKASADWLPDICSRGDLMVILDVSETTIANLKKKNLLVEGAARGQYLTLQSLHTYITYLREQAAGRASSTGISLSDERALTERVNRETAELRLATLRGEVLKLDEVEPSWSNFAGAIKAAALAIPSKARQMIPHLTAHDAETLKDLVRDMLNDLADEVEDTVLGADPSDVSGDK